MSYSTDSDINSRQYDLVINNGGYMLQCIWFCCIILKAFKDRRSKMIGYALPEDHAFSCSLFHY